MLYTGTVLFMFSFQCIGLYSQTTYDCFLCVCLGHGGGELHGDLQREGARPPRPDSQRQDRTQGGDGVDQELFVPNPDPARMKGQTN